MKTKGYDEGGFLDDGASVDPISGNEVPTGSLQEEVRDDIPAKLSEGEFVFPADVVRFIGLGQLMKIRDKAKTGLVEMEEEGQIGGTPTPPEIIMDDEDMAMDAMIEGLDSDNFEEQAMNFAEGGLMPRSNLPSHKDFIGDTAPNGIKNVQYTNDAGDIITIRSLRGEPVQGQVVPEGYYPVGSKPEDPENPITEDPVGNTPSTVNDSTPNKDAFDRGDTRRDEAALVQSQIIRGARMQVLEALYKDNMTGDDMDLLYSSISPAARVLYENKLRNPSDLDAMFTFGKPKNHAERLISAQKSIDNRNAALKITEPMSYYTGNGKAVNLKDLLKFVSGKMTAEALESLSPISLLKKIIPKILAGPKTTVGNDNDNQPTMPVPGKVLNQAHWAARLKAVKAEHPNNPQLVGRILREEKNWESYKAGTDPYGFALKESIWEKLTPEQRATAALEGTLNKSDTFTNEVVTATGTIAPPEFLFYNSAVPKDDGTTVPVAKTLTGRDDGNLGSPTATTVPVAKTLTGRDDGNLGSPTATTAPAITASEPVIYDTPSMDNTIDAGLRKARDATEMAAATKSGDAFLKDVIKTPTLQVEDPVTYTDYSPSPGTGYQPMGTGVTGEVGEAGEVADLSTSELSFIDDLVLSGQKAVDTLTGMYDDVSKAMGNSFDSILLGSQESIENRRVEAAAIAAQKKADRDAERYRYTEIYNKDTGGGPKGRGNKNRSDVKGTGVTQKQIDDANQQNSGRFDDKPSVTKPAVTKPSDQQNSGRFDDKPTVTKPAKVEQKYIGGQYRLNKGGLASKKTPVVKKMRQDPTAGLAAKKKSKQKAQAKKGALAAKRT